jgi:hypothetical protein
VKECAEAETKARNSTRMSSSNRKTPIVKITEQTTRSNHSQSMRLAAKLQ